MSWASRHNLLARAVNRHLGGVPVIWGAVSDNALLEKNAQLIADGNAISTDYVLHNLPSEKFQALRYGDLLQVDGAAYSVREPMPVGDGAYMMVSLSLEPVVTTLFKLLLEDGSYLLLEDGGLLLLES
jgi:hypothetical protein